MEKPAIFNLDLFLNDAEVDLVRGAFDLLSRVDPRAIDRAVSSIRMSESVGLTFSPADGPTADLLSATAAVIRELHLSGRLLSERAKLTTSDTFGRWGRVDEPRTKRRAKRR